MRAQWFVCFSVCFQKDWYAKRKKFKRPAQRLFDAEKIRCARQAPRNASRAGSRLSGVTRALLIDRALGGEVSHDGDFMIFEANRYSRKGFLFKSFAMSAVVSSKSSARCYFDRFFFFF